MDPGSQLGMLLFHIPLSAGSSWTPVCAWILVFPGLKHFLESVVCMWRLKGPHPSSQPTWVSPPNAVTTNKDRSPTAVSNVFASCGFVKILGNK